MKTLTTTVILGAAWLAGCAAPPLPIPAAGASQAELAASTLPLKAQAHQLRTHITERKQKIAVFEVMLTDVERRAARSQTPLSYLPNTNLPSEVTAAAPANDRLGVAVRPSPAVAAAPAIAVTQAKPVARKPGKPPVKKKKTKRHSVSVRY